MKAQSPPQKSALGSSFRVDISRIALPRPVGSAGHNEVKHMLARELERAWLLPYASTGFILPYSSSGLYDLANIAGILQGRDASLPPILIGAHYDTCGYSPGADDNAAAICILFSVLERLKGKGLNRSLICVFFDAEEPPFFLTSTMGSINFYHSRLEHDLQYACILDLVGHDVPYDGLEDVVFITGIESNAALESAINSLQIVSGIRALPTLNRYIGDLSDYHVFRVHGVPYLFFSCGRWEHYHMESDTVEKLNFSKMKALSRYLANLIAECDRLDFHTGNKPFDTLDTELRFMNLVLSKVLPDLGLAKLKDRKDIDLVAGYFLTRLGL